jgi:hypothetical protein
MTSPRLPPEVSLRGLIDAACSGTIGDEQFDRLEAVLAESEEARRLYLRYCTLEGDLHYLASMTHADEAMRGRTGSAGGVGEPDAAPIVPPIIIDTRAAGLFSVGTSMFSYAAATVVMGLALLVLGTWHTSHRAEIAPPGPSASLPPSAGRIEVVGRITGLAECRWADRAAAALEHDSVPIGRRYALLAGFLEITYQSGARVILEGPVTYEVDSAAGGFLSRGKLTARIGARGERTANPTLAQGESAPTASLAPRPSAATIERMGEGRRAKGEEDAERGQWAASPTAQDLRPKTQDPYSSPLFSVRTPTAVVVDLGTEFGVEVDRRGVSRAHVFQGKVELQPVNSRGPTAPGEAADGPAIYLCANESARVEVDDGRGARVVREAGRSIARAFTRQMPGQVQIEVFSTGVGLREGDPDPHWQVVARSDDPHFRPRPAVVTAVGPEFLRNNPAESQWLSIGNGPPALPRGVTLTFRTTCVAKVTGPSGRVPSLDMRLWANERVKAIRVNGKTVPALDKAASAGRDVFNWNDAMLEGVNYLEFDVTNEGPSRATGASPVLLKMTFIERRATL